MSPCYLNKYPHAPSDEAAVSYLPSLRPNSEQKCVSLHLALLTGTKQNGAPWCTCHRGLQHTKAGYSLTAGICDQLIWKVQIVNGKLTEIWSSLMKKLVGSVSPPKEV